MEKIQLETSVFQNVRNQIGFCGIWCGSCLGGNGAVQELTRKYEQVVKRSQLAIEKWTPKEFSFNEFMKGLACIEAMQLCPGCRKGGGPSTCNIRICALGKSLSDCSQCNELADCKNFGHLEKTNPKIKEELSKLKTSNQDQLLKKWTDELAQKWPDCVLICKAPKQW